MKEIKCIENALVFYGCRPQDSTATIGTDRSTVSGDCLDRVGGKVEVEVVKKQSSGSIAGIVTFQIRLANR